MNAPTIAAAPYPRPRVEASQRQTHRQARTSILIAYGLCFALVVTLLACDGSVRWGDATWAIGLQALIGGVLVAPPPPHWRYNPGLGVLMVIGYLVSVALLRAAAGPLAGFGPLVLLPVAFAALRGRRVELVVSIVGVATVYVVPEILVGAPRYPTGSWRAGMLFTVVAIVVGVSTIRLVERIGGLLDRLAALARTDELTGLANRRAWDEALAHAVLDTRRSEPPLTVVLFDLDGFKTLNDTVGHLAADRMLRAAAAGWSTGLRKGDLLARWGGDEFALLLPGCECSQARRLVELMRVAYPNLSFSAGFAELSAGMTPEALLTAADAELYRAKAGLGEPGPAEPAELAPIG